MHLIWCVSGIGKLTTVDEILGLVLVSRAAEVHLVAQTVSPYSFEQFLLVFALRRQMS
jgi:hypothetical protein